MATRGGLAEPRRTTGPQSRGELGAQLYKKVGGKTGTAKLTGMVTVATSQGAQEPLELESEIRVR